MAETVEKKRVTEKKKAVREVLFQLDDTELVKRAREAADLRLAGASIEEEFSRVKSTYKGRIEEKKNQISSLLDVIKNGEEKRVVEVLDVYDYEHAVVEAFYDDKVVERRVMTADERQLGLGFEHMRPTKKKQTELPLPERDEGAALDYGLENLPPFELPDPGHKRQEEYVTNQSLVKNRTVAFHGKSWLLEPGESSTFHVVEEEVFGKNILVWDQLNTSKLAKPTDPTEETAADEPSTDEEPLTGEETPA